MQSQDEFADLVVASICRIAANAIDQYRKSSLEKMEYVYEHIIEASVVAHLGFLLPIRNQVEMRRLCAPEILNEASKRYGKNISSRKIDLVVFRPAMSDSMLQPLIAIEVKRWKLSKNDEDRLIKVRELLPSCEYLVRLLVRDSALNDSKLDEMEVREKSKGNKFFREPLAAITGDTKSYCVVACMGKGAPPELAEVEV